MSTVPQDLRYTREHEWARLDDDGRVTIGVTDFAQEQLGDVVFLDLPEVDASVEGGEPLGEVESTKSVSDLYAPVSGRVVEVNLECKDNPAAVNQDPYGEGWLLVVDPSDPTEYDGLMSPEEYADFLEEEAGEGDEG
ncbi:MAG TPA: glycine cleavage system protein GcvH [Actinomycetota bacterium]|nr:glycine cleavage system protein GcvH [Actinomycetota bacterium]